MAIVNGYTTLAAFKARYGDAVNETRDANIEGVIEEASRQVDEICHRVFYPMTTAEARYYAPEFRDQVTIDDAYEITSVKADEDGDGVFEAVWLASDYVKSPYNAPARGRPWTELEVAVNGTRVFPRGLGRSLEVTAKYGWLAVPHAVRGATLLIAGRLWKRIDTPLGATSAAPGVGQITVKVPKDDDPRMLLEGYIRSL